LADIQIHPLRARRGAARGSPFYPPGAVAGRSRRARGEREILIHPFHLREGEYTLCQVDDNPQEIVAAAEAKTKLVYLSGGGSRRSSVPKYSSVRFVENPQ
jgi:hypothetical protein